MSLNSSVDSGSHKKLKISVVCNKTEAVKSVSVVEDLVKYQELNADLPWKNILSKLECDLLWSGDHSRHTYLRIEHEE
jgi:hypothetical protein